nr:AMP nucleosidase [Desulfobacterales bacterium]
MREVLKEHEYARHTLERYTDCHLKDFRSHIILTNFNRYVDCFCKKTKGTVRKAQFSTVHVPDMDCTLINFGIGSPQAALVMHCLAFVDGLKSVIMLGMCGGIDDVLKVGDFIIPSACIRGEGSSRHYLPIEFPAIPTFAINKFCFKTVKEMGFNPKSGIVYSTDRRMWEFDKDFVSYLRNYRIMGIDMELATLYTIGYAYQIPIGSIMLVSDMPLQRRGIKSKESYSEIYSRYMETHIDMGINTVKAFNLRWDEVERTLSSEW